MTIRCSSSYNILIQENNTAAGTVLLTLTTPQDNGEGLTGSIGLVQVSFTSLKTGFFELGLTEQSKFIQNSAPAKLPN